MGPHEGYIWDLYGFPLAQMAQMAQIMPIWAPYGHVTWVSTLHVFLGFVA